MLRSLVFAAALAGCHAAPGDAAPAGKAAGTVPAGESFACTPVRLWDGDGPIWCAEGPRVRLAGIAAREADGTCRPGHPCPAASGEEAKRALASLLAKGRGAGIRKLPSGHLAIDGASVLRCVSDGSAGGSRTAAWCGSPHVGDLSCAMLRSGTVARWDRYWKRKSCD